ncbi:reverse transcriptase domain-containing protein [Candidatus Phytoplasma australasiaticum]|uniref:reverse transcriptase domain-containing protein n=1 Tax=Candidatus Phytoplasma australasiaticum TaxID=2754999 RepID=UPI003B9808F1
MTEAQGTFVKGRQILDQALIANEAIEDYRARDREGIIFKIDFEKAYDHVDWSFLDKVLEKKGLGYKWRSWLLSCVRTVQYSILINGKPRGNIKATRGLRQGDPLSPFPFLLIVDSLSRMVWRSLEGGIIEGFEVGREKVALSHLQFVDDTIFFCSGRQDSFLILNYILRFFESLFFVLNR